MTVVTTRSPSTPFGVQLLRARICVWDSGEGLPLVGGEESTAAAGTTARIGELAAEPVGDGYTPP